MADHAQDQRRWEPEEFKGFLESCPDLEALEIQRTAQATRRVVIDPASEVVHVTDPAPGSAPPTGPS